MAILNRYINKITVLFAWRYDGSIIMLEMTSTLYIIIEWNSIIFSRITSLINISSQISAAPYFLVAYDLRFIHHQKLREARKSNRGYSSFRFIICPKLFNRASVMPFSSSMHPHQVHPCFQNCHRQWNHANVISNLSSNQPMLTQPHHPLLLLLWICQQPDDV